MAVTLSTPTNVITGVAEPSWGNVVIGEELFIGSYYTPSNKIFVYDANTMVLKRTLNTIVAYYYSIGTDGTDLYVKMSDNKLSKVDKNTGTTLSTTTIAFTMGSSASFRIDLANDRIYCCNYASLLNIYKFSTGELLKSCTLPTTNTAGVEIVKNKYIIVTCYSGNKIYISKLDSNLNNLAFTLLYSSTSNIVGSSYYNGYLMITTYSANVMKGQIDGLVFYTTKYLIQDKNNILWNVSGGRKEYTGNLIPTMTSDTAPIGVASASSVYSSSYPAWKAFNGNSSTLDNSWYSVASTTTAWLRYDFEDFKLITDYKITSYNYSASRAYDPKSWTFEGSNDGETWDILDTQVSQVFLQNQTKTYEFDNNKVYKCYRLNISSIDTSKGVVIAEFQMGGYSPIILYNLNTNTLSDALFIDKGIDDPLVINNQLLIQKGIYAIDKGALGSGKLFEFNISQLYKTIDIIE